MACTRCGGPLDEERRSQIATIGTARSAWDSDAPRTTVPYRPDQNLSRTPSPPERRPTPDAPRAPTEWPMPNVNSRMRPLAPPAQSRGPSHPPDDQAARITAEPTPRPSAPRFAGIPGARVPTAYSQSEGPRHSPLIPQAPPVPRFPSDIRDDRFSHEPLPSDEARTLPPVAIDPDRWSMTHTARPAHDRFETEEPSAFSLNPAKPQARLSKFGPLSFVAGSATTLLALHLVASRPNLLPAVRAESAAREALRGAANQSRVKAEHALAEGNFESARAHLEESETLGEALATRTLRARVSVALADAAWLRERVLPDAPADVKAAARQNLLELLNTARGAADRAAEAAPDDPITLLTRVNALRLLGDLDAARTLASRVRDDGHAAARAYATALIDLAERRDVPFAIERLRLSTAEDEFPGRARAALVYAYALSGERVTALRELDKLTALGRPYPGLSDLRAFVDRTAPPAPETQKAPEHEHSEHTDSRGHAAGHVDIRRLLERAERARRDGEGSRAETLYTQVLGLAPMSSEALAGLGAVALEQKKYDIARDHFDRATAVNPDYAPAVIGLANVDWERGQRESARRRYRELQRRFPSDVVPNYVRERAADTR